MKRVDPTFRNKLQNFGAKNWNECFHCGNCTASCPHTENGFLFPRKTIRTYQMGLSDSIHSSLDPWMCYYCGDCSETCPRDANPGELMMSLRRYLTSIYDWTGLSTFFYTSIRFLISGLILLALVILGIAFSKNFNAEALMHFGHRFEIFAILSVATLILLPNVIRMYYLTIVREKVKAPILSYFSGLSHLIQAMFVQKNTLRCKESNIQWFEHLLLVISYLTLLFVTVFLNWFGSENSFIIFLGYFVGSITFVITFLFIINRLRKKTSLRKFSHPSDWLFVIWLFIMGLSAFIVRLIIDFSSIEQHFWIYLIHLVILAQWALIIVPFGKWTHFIYRSFAVYFAHLKKAAMQKQDQTNMSLRTI